MATDFTPDNSTPGGSRLRAFVRRALEWLRLVDEDDGQLSLTNLAVWVALAKLVFVAAATVLDLGTFSGAMLAYGYKAHRRGKAAEAQADREAVATVAGVDPATAMAPTVARVEALAGKVSEWEGRLEALGSTIKLGMTGRR